MARRVWRVAGLAAAIALGQALLYGPSLLGRRILLPLDQLGEPQTWLPDTPEWRGVRARDPLHSDPVLSLEPWRRHAAAELRAGRLPLWNPYSFAGSPFAVFGKYSPFALLSYAFPDPRGLAWRELLEALVAGTGAFLFFRRVVGAGTLASAAGAACLPLTGAFVLWRAYPATEVLAFYPWLLLAVDAVVRRPGGRAGPGLALLVALALLCGQLDVAAMALLAAGLFAAFRLGAAGRRPRSAAALALLAAVAIGAALAAPYWLPLVEYARTGKRMAARSRGAEERPPLGLAALPEIALPEAQGTTRRGDVRRLPTNRAEGAASAYAGLFAALVLAPWAWTVRRHRALAAFWLASGVLWLAWILDLPGWASLVRASPARALSANRFALFAGFGILATAVAGLDALARGEARRRLALGAAPVLLLGLGAFSLAASRGSAQAAGAALCALALGAWAWLLARPRPPRAAAGLLALALAAELLFWARRDDFQSDPALYYPEIPALSRLAQAPPGRVLGVACLPASLLLVARLPDVRGYDGVDPARLVDLLGLAAHAQDGALPYARVQYYNARVELEPPDRALVSPVLDLLNVRHLVLRGVPPQGFRPRIAEAGYFVLENPRALPRAFVPRRVRAVSNDRARLAILGAPDFDARDLALVETSVAAEDGARGEVRILEEEPSRVLLEAELDRPGLVVLADLWDAGWRAWREGDPTAVLRANHALRGIAVPAGPSRIELRYEPEGLRTGLAAALGAGLAWLGWCAWAGAAAARPSLGFARLRASLAAAWRVRTR